MIAASLNDLLSMVFAPLEGGISSAAPLGLLILGLVTGIRHALETDHLAAVSTLIATSDQRKVWRAPLMGALWGVGHTAVLFVAGIVVLLFAVSIPKEITGRLEFGVGVMLIFLAVSALTGFSFGRFLRGLTGLTHVHRHRHFHGDTGIVHTHDHDHHQEHKHTHKSILVGMVHGLAGSGALMVIVLSTIDSVPLGLGYIAIFGVGSIGSMAAMSALIGLPLSRIGSNRKISLLLRYTAAAVTLMIGFGMVYDLGVIQRVLI